MSKQVTGKYYAIVEMVLEATKKDYSIEDVLDNEDTILAAVETADDTDGDSYDTIKALFDSNYHKSTVDDIPGSDKVKITAYQLAHVTDYQDDNGEFSESEILDLSEM